MKSILGKVVVTLFAALYGFSFLMDTGVVPSDRVQTHSEIADKQMNVRLTEGIIDQGEHIEHFYSEGLLSVREGGSILTDRRVISYAEDEDDELWILEFAFDEVVSIEQTREGTTFDYAIYLVNGEGEDNYLKLWLPPENGDAARFVDALQAKIGN